MNLASNTACVPSTMPSRVAAIHVMAECLTLRWTSVTRRPVLRSYQERCESLRRSAKLDQEVTRQILGFGLAALLAPQLDQGGLVIPHDDPRIRAADEVSSTEGASPRARFHGSLLPPGIIGDERYHKILAGSICSGSP
jgi:hypothetical protein